MTAYWLAQGVGVIAFLIGITTFFDRDERRFKLQLAVYSATIGVHFFLMGAWPAGMSAELNTVRTLVSMRTRRMWVMALFIVLTLVLSWRSCSMLWSCCRLLARWPAPGRSFAARG